MQVMGAVLSIKLVQHMLTDQGFVPGWGLDKNLQEYPQILADKKIIQSHLDSMQGWEIFVRGHCRVARKHSHKMEN